MKIGKIELKNNIFLAPMAGITDMAFRLLCKEQGAGLLYTEMVSCKGLYYKDKKTDKLLEINDTERPVAAQIFGSDSEIMKETVHKILNDKDDIDIIDINMGCPAPKIVKNGDGSALLKKPELIEKIVKEVVNVSNKPVTVKIRKGWDDNSINAVEVAKIVENSGANAITVHGRTREQFYSGVADWDIIKEVKKNVGIPVIGNGDIFTAQDGKNMFDYTGCDGIMIGRGARGNPWLFKDILDYIYDNKLPTPHSDEEKIEMCIRHLELLTKIKREDIAVKEMRKHAGWYIKGMKNSTLVRGNINKMNTKEEFISLLREYYI